MNVAVYIIQLPKARSCGMKVIYIVGNLHIICNQRIGLKPKHCINCIPSDVFHCIISKSYEAETETPQLSHQLLFLAVQSFLQSEALSPNRCAQNLEPSGEGPPNDFVPPQILSFGLPC